MDSLLKKKYDSLQNAEDFECWYLVKQPTEFSSICYLVSILEKYQSEHSSDVFQTYVESKISDINRERHLDISSNYRALRIAAFYGLIKMETSSYQDSILTETYYEIKNRCEGNFENISTYSDIIQRQIEKMYASTSIDEKFDSVRSNFRLYPVLFLYKILLEIGYATNNYSISLDEYRYLVATSTTYNKFLETLLLVQKWRDASDSDRNLFSSFRGKFDNRFIQALKQLTTLSIDSSNISLKRECISEVAQKVYSFEKYLRNEKFDDSKLVDFLCSKEWLVDEKNDDKKNENVDDEIQSHQENLEQSQKKAPEPYAKQPSQIIYYGVPGCGKSYEVNKVINAELDKYGVTDKEYHKVRCVFHPEYCNADFVGQIYPYVKPDNGGVEYRFKPGPFAEIVRRAYRNPAEPFFLVIEEINRGNAAAIFGEMFQLLDRIRPEDGPEELSGNIYNTGWSSYGVTNIDVNAYVRQKSTDNPEKIEYDYSIPYGDKIKFINNTAVRLPPNLSIYATMNTNDQNVFTMDNAFQRRFKSKMIRNVLDENSAQYKTEIDDTGVCWGDFREWINEKILLPQTAVLKADDKCLGGWFITGEKINGVDKIKKEDFAEKVLKYLWDDVFKRNKSGEIFVKDDKVNSLSDLIDAFETSVGFESFEKIFKMNDVDKAKLQKQANT